MDLEFGQPFDPSSDTVDNARQAPHRIAILDENPVLCEALAVALNANADYKCYGFSADRKKALRIVAQHKPCLVVFDPNEIDLSFEHDLIDFSQEIRQAHPEVRLLGYTSRMDEDMLRAVVEARFSGCVGKKSDLGQLNLAITAALSGAVYFDPFYASLLGDVLPMQDPETELLSEREREVLIRLARGQNAKQIGRDLEISAKTVNTYKARAYQKLDLQSREDLVEYALSRGWVG